MASGTAWLKTQTDIPITTQWRTALQEKADLSTRRLPLASRRIFKRFYGYGHVIHRRTLSCRSKYDLNISHKNDILGINQTMKSPSE